MYLYSPIRPHGLHMDNCTFTFTSYIGRKHEIREQDGLRERSDRKEIREAEREKITKGRNGKQT